MKKPEILRELDAYIEAVKVPPSASEIADGWGPMHKQKALRMMSELRDALSGKTAMPRWSIVRTMDSWGVSGDLFDRACAISHHIHKIED